jgi:type IV pilus assembly protein PilN
MIKINLLAEGKRPAAVRRARPAALLEGKNLTPYMLVGSLALFIAAAGVWWWRLDDTIEEKQSAIEDAQEELRKLETIKKEVDQYKADKAELERKIGVINDLKLAQRGPVRVMDHISRALPELLWLDRMRMTTDSIELDGRALNTNAVANFIENLDKVPAFEEPTLIEATEQPGGVYKFVIHLRYSFAPPPAAGATPATPAPAGAGAPAPATS